MRFVPPENWHVTLRFLGDADTDDVSAALDTAVLPAAIARLGAGVDLLFDRLLAVPVTGVENLADCRRSRHPRAGHRAAGTPLRRTSHRRPLPTAAPSMPPALGALVRAEWDVTEIALVHSRLRPTGAEYETVATWPVPTARP